MRKELVSGNWVCVSDLLLCLPCHILPSAPPVSMDVFEASLLLIARLDCVYISLHRNPCGVLEYLYGMKSACSMWVLCKGPLKLLSYTGNGRTFKQEMQLRGA